MDIIYPFMELEIPLDVAQANGPFEEFKQDVSIVTVKLNSGEIFERVMLLYPNYVIAVAEHHKLPFKPSDVVEVTQSPRNKRRFEDSSWVYWYNPNEFSENA